MHNDPTRLPPVDPDKTGFYTENFVEPNALGEYVSYVATPGIGVMVRRPGRPTVPWAQYDQEMRERCAQVATGQDPGSPSGAAG